MKDTRHLHHIVYLALHPGKEGGKKVEQTLKRATYLINNEWQRDQLLPFILTFKIWLLYFIEISQKRLSKEAWIIDLARNRFLTLLIPQLWSTILNLVKYRNMLNMWPQHFGDGINWIWNDKLWMRISEKWNYLQKCLSWPNIAPDYITRL